MCTPCAHHEKPLSLDVIPNPNSNLDCSKLYHMTSRSRAYLLSLFPCRLIIIILNPNPSPSLSTHSSYNRWTRTSLPSLQVTSVLNMRSRRVRIIKSARQLTLPETRGCKVVWLCNLPSTSLPAKACSTYILITTPNLGMATSMLSLCMASWSISLWIPSTLKSPLSEWKNIFLVNLLTVQKLMKLRILGAWVKPYGNSSMWSTNLNRTLFLWKTTLHSEAKSKRSSTLSLKNPLFPATIRMQPNWLMSCLCLLQYQQNCWRR